jgi:hypothetical protein
METFYKASILDIEGRSAVSTEYFMDIEDAIKYTREDFDVETFKEWNISKQGRAEIFVIHAWEKGEFNPDKRRVFALLTKLSEKDIELLKKHFRDGAND